MVNVEDAICGRIGYAAPENVVRGYLTEKADVCVVLVCFYLSFWLEGGLAFLAVMMKPFNQIE